MLHSNTNIQQNVFPQQEDCIASVFFHNYPLHLDKVQKYFISLSKIMPQKVYE